MGESVNIGRLMRENAIVDKCKIDRRVFRVSKAAIEEYVGRVVDRVEMDMPLICRIAEGSGRNTVLEEDVICFFSYAGR